MLFQFKTKRTVILYSPTFTKGRLLCNSHLLHIDHLSPSANSPYIYIILFYTRDYVFTTAEVALISSQNNLFIKSLSKANDFYFKTDELP